MLQAYRQHTADRQKLGIPPLPLNTEQTTALCELLKNPPDAEKKELLMLLRDRVPPGVDEAAYVKAGFLTAIATQMINLNVPWVTNRASGEGVNYQNRLQRGDNGVGRESPLQ